MKLASSMSGRMACVLALTVAMGAAQGGQKIHFADRDAGRAPAVELKNKTSFAPEKQIDFNTQPAGAPADLLVPQPSEDSAKTAMDKRQRRAVEERKDWIRNGAVDVADQEMKKRDEKNIEDEEKDPLGGKRDGLNTRRELRPGEPVAPGEPRRPTGSLGKNNPTPNFNFNPTPGGLKKDPLGLPTTGFGNSSGLSPGPDLRGGLPERQFSSLPDERQAARKADMDRFMSLLNPPPPKDLGNQNLGLAPAVPSGPGSAGPAAAPFSTGPRAFDPRPAGTFGDLSGKGPAGSGLPSGFNGNQDDPARRFTPAPTILPIPRRNF